MLKLSFYVPETHLEAVKLAVFEAGAGQFPDYKHACWQCLGTGQFIPLESSNPHIGEMNQLEHVSEYKVEMICEEKHIQGVLRALHQAHPYECPAYDVVQLMHIDF